jgi:hypothetical protein
MTRKLILLAALGFLSAPLQAQASALITLGGTNAGLTLTGNGTTVTASIAANTGQNPVAGTILNGVPPGTIFGVTFGYSLGAVSLTAGPNGSGPNLGIYPVTTQSAPETFTYLDDGNPNNALTGSILWSFVHDNTPNPTFSGSMTVLTSSGSAGFTSQFMPGAVDPINLTIASLLPGFQTLDALVAAKGTANVGISTGAIEALPLPAALPLFATGLGALGLLGWRRKRKARAVA